ncbi:24_t:CDS:2, partial [Acaulospora morrowiae]
MDMICMLAKLVGTNAPDISIKDRVCTQISILYRWAKQESFGEFNRTIYSKIIMMKKKFRNTRTRVDFDDDDADAGLQGSDLKVGTEKIVKKKTKDLRSKTILSFGTEEEENETFKVTKSQASRRLAQTKSKKLTLDQLNQATISPSYTNELLSELRANTPATPA